MRLAWALVNRRTSTAGRLAYSLAVLVAHEIGHVVQVFVGQPVSDNAEGIDEQSRITEQQADCFIGVWVADAAQAGQVNLMTFRAIAEQELTLLTQLPVRRALASTTMTRWRRTARSRSGWRPTTLAWRADLARLVAWSGSLEAKVHGAWLPTRFGSHHEQDFAHGKSSGPADRC